ncbi:MAG: polysaccharide biosynthesis tyrosine autokinase [Dehalococcoidia bacterium]
MEREAVNLRTYWRLLLRWWWVLVLGVAGAAVAAFFVSNQMTPIYEAAAKVQVEGGQTPGVPSAGDLEASRQLAQTYGDLIKTRPILEQVIETESLPYGPDKLSGKISVSSSRRLITIKAKDPDPVLAAQLVNTTAQTFIEEIRDRQFTQIAQFQASLGQYGISQDPSIIAAQAATMGNLSIVENAVPPSSPSSPRTALNMFLASILGLAVAVGVVFVLERLDDSIKSPDDLKAITGLSTIGVVLHHKTSDRQRPITLTDEHQDSILAESYKFLRTNLEFAALGTDGIGTLLVTSSSPKEGKTTTATNLAIAIARGGKSVILVDSDLRRPALHRMFDIENQKGLTNLLLGNATLEEVMAPTAVDGLQVIPSGPLPPDATVVLRSPRMKEAVAQFQDAADMVILDSPPLLVVTDPMLLAAMVSGVLLVVDPGTSRDAVRQAAESLRQANPPLIASMLNKVSTKGKRDYYYYHYYYYYDYYSSEDGANVPHRANGRLGFLTRVLRRGHRRRKEPRKT